METTAIIAACEAMYRLNRVAKQAGRQSAYVIYQQKGELIEFLYGAGYCVAAYEHVRTHEEFDDYDEYTSTKRERLVCFEFEIEDKRYCWHTKSAEFPWVPTAPSDTWNEGRVGETVIMSAYEISEALRTVEIITADPSAVECRRIRTEQWLEAYKKRRKKKQLAERALKAKINRRLAPLGQRLYKDRPYEYDIYTVLDEQGDAIWQGPLEIFECPAKNLP